MITTVNQVAERTFDYVVIGGGPAGLTLASRLSEDSSVTVALLEAGPANLDDPLINIPAQFGRQLGNPRYDWIFKTIPQPHCNDREYGWGRGKTLGGSSAINFSVWSKPPAEDINAWEKLGNPGWNWERFQAYAKKVEGFTPPKPGIQKQYRQVTQISSHGTEGPLKTMFPEVIMAGDKSFQDTIHALGIEVARDPSGGNPLGTFNFVGTMDPKTHTRTYAVTAYYNPSKDKPNFTVLCDALVQRILNSGGKDELLQATGVEFSYGGNTLVVHALKEVILCAGALKSPQILELSGIGDPNILEPLGIETKVHLPGVGANSQEHTLCGVTFELDPSQNFETLDRLNDPVYHAEQMKLHQTQQGIFRLGIGNVTFIPLNKVTLTQDIATSLIAVQRGDIEKHFENANLAPGLREQWQIQIERLESGRGADCELICFPQAFGFVPEPGKACMTIIAATNHPFARGTVHITSTDPNVQPAIDPHYFEEEFDLISLTEIVKFIRRLAVVEPFKNIIVKEAEPGPNISNDEDLKNYVKAAMCTTFHTASTAAMRPRDKNGVVDPKLKVYGTKNIRVADLSIIPLHFAAHSQCAAYVIGEIAADIILGKL